MKKPKKIIGPALRAAASARRDRAAPPRENAVRPPEKRPGATAVESDEAYLART